MQYAFDAADNALDRENRLATANISADASSSGGIAGAAGNFLGELVNGMAITKSGFFAGT